MTHIPAERLADIGGEAMTVRVLLDGRWQKCSSRNTDRWKPAQRFVQEGLEVLFTIPSVEDPAIVLSELEKVYQRTRPRALLKR